MRWKVHAVLVTDDGRSDRYRTRDLVCEIEAVSYKAACQYAREQFATPFTSVWIDHNPARMRKRRREVAA
jgi:hypothetical protein